MLVLIVLLLLTIAIGFAPGLALFAVVPGLLLIAYLAWIGVAFASGRSPAMQVRRSGRRGPELLGPGGPDDPDR